MGIGFRELLVILVIVALVFGTRKLKSLGGDLGGAIKSFRDAFRDSEDKPAPDDASGKSGVQTGDDAKISSGENKNQGG